MKKVLVFLFVSMVVLDYSHAQTFFSLQWEVAEPTESFSKSAGTGYGFKGTYIHFINQRIGLTGSAGYTKWGPRRDFPPNNEFKVVAVPVQLGMRFLLAKGVVAPYVGVSVGMDYLRIRGIAPNSTTNTYSDESQLKFGLSPEVGLGIFLVGPVGVMINGSYNVIYTSDSSSKYFGLNAGLAVGF